MNKTFFALVAILLGLTVCGGSGSNSSSKLDFTTIPTTSVTIPETIR